MSSYDDWVSGKLDDQLAAPPVNNQTNYEGDVRARRRPDGSLVIMRFTEGDHVDCEPPTNPRDEVNAAHERLADAYDERNKWMNRAAKAEAENETLNTMLGLAAREYCHWWVQTHDLTTDAVPTMDDWLADLRARAEEGSE